MSYSSGGNSGGCSWPRARMMRPGILSAGIVGNSRTAAASRWFTFSTYPTAARQIMPTARYGAAPAITGQTATGPR